MRPAALISIIAVLVAGCSEFPELQSSDSNYVRQAKYPTLVPIEDLGLVEETDETPDEASRLNSRVQSLRNRARQLQGDVINDADRLRLEQGVIEG